VLIVRCRRWQCTSESDPQCWHSLGVWGSPGGHQVSRFTV